MKTLDRKQETEAPLDEMLRAWLEDLTLAEPQRVGLLEITPLTSSRNGPRPWIVMAEALDQGVLDLKEKEGGGDVNEVDAYNRGKQPVLIFEGETIIGAKQNRVVITSVLVAAGSMVGIPVGCMEQGRWRVMSDKFEPGAASMSPLYRKKAVREFVAFKAVNQARLWDDVAEEMAVCDVDSPSVDYHVLMKKRAHEAKERSRVFKNVDGQVGVLATFDGTLLGCEIFGHPVDWQKLSERLMKSYMMGIQFMEDMGARAKTEEARRGERPASEWWNAIRSASATPMPARGLGVQMAIKGDGFSGAGLWVDERAAHLGVFG